MIFLSGQRIISCRISYFTLTSSLVFFLAYCEYFLESCLGWYSCRGYRKARYPGNMRSKIQVRNISSVLREMLYKRLQLLPHSYILYIDKEQNYMDQLLILIQASLKSFCKMIKNLSIKYQVYIVSCNILSKSTVCEPLNISSNAYYGEMF